MTDSDWTEALELARQIQADLRAAIHDLREMRSDMRAIDGRLDAAGRHHIAHDLRLSALAHSALHHPADAERLADLDRRVARIERHLKLTDAD